MCVCVCVFINRSLSLRTQKPTRNQRWYCYSVKFIFTNSFPTRPSLDFTLVARSQKQPHVFFRAGLPQLCVYPGRFSKWLGYDDLVCAPWPHVSWCSGGWKLISSISRSRLPLHTGSCSVYRRCSAWFACIRTFTFICMLIFLMRSVESRGICSGRRDLKLHYQFAVFVDKSEFGGVVLFFFTSSSLCSSLSTFYSLII